MNGVAAGHGFLAGIARRLAQGFEGCWKGGGAVFVSCELALECLDCCESGTLRSGARVLNTQREGEPDNCPYACDSDKRGDDELRGGALLALLWSGFGAGLDLSRAAVRADGAGGVNWALAVRAEVHSIGQGVAAWPEITRPTVSGALPAAALK